MLISRHLYYLKIHVRMWNIKIRAYSFYTKSIVLLWRRSVKSFSIDPGAQ